MSEIIRCINWSYNLDYKINVLYIIHGSVSLNSKSLLSFHKLTVLDVYI